MRRSKTTKPRLSKGRAKLPPRGLKEMQLTDADSAKLIAAKHCLFHYPTLYTAGVPRSPSNQSTRLWTVPIIATHPEKGMLAEVGELTVDVREGKAVAGTPRTQVVAGGAHFYKVRSDAKAAHSLQAGKNG